MGKDPDQKNPVEAPKLRWRKTKGHIFLAAGAFSLILALIVVAILVITTLFEAAVLVQIKTADQAGLVLQKRVYDQYVQGQDPLGHPYIATAPLEGDTELAKMGWVEVRYFTIEIPADADEAEREEILALAQRINVQSKIGKGFDQLVNEFGDNPYFVESGVEPERFTYGKSRFDGPNDPFFSKIVFAMQVGATDQVITEERVYFIQVIQRDVLNFVPESTAIVQVSDVRPTEPEDIWELIAEQESSQFALPVYWVPHSKYYFGNLELVRTDVRGIYDTRISNMPENSIAVDAGFQVGDILLSVDGYKINGPANAYDAIAFASKEAITNEVLFSVDRDGEILEIPLRTKYSREIQFNRSVQYSIWDFLTTVSAAAFAERGGLLAAMMGTVMVLVIMMLFAFPLGAMAAVYLEEYATKNLFTDALQILIANLAGIPSVAYGLIALAVFARFLGLGSSILSGGLTLGLVILPIMIIAAREALRAIPPSIREAAYGVGATRWQVIRHQVLPNSLPGIFTGMILSLAQAIGEVAPLLMLGATIFITQIPESFMDRFTVIPMQIFKWALRPQSGFDHLAAAAIILLLLIMILLNLFAIWLRRRFQKTW